MLYLFSVTLSKIEIDMSSKESSQLFAHVEHHKGRAQKVIVEQIGNEVKIESCAVCPVSALETKEGHIDLREGFLGAPGYRLQAVLTPVR